MSEFKNVTDVVNAVRYAVKAQGKWSAFVADNGVTRETLSVTAHALAVLAFPTDEPRVTVPKTDDNGNVIKGKNGKAVQIRTRYGNAVQAAKSGLESALDKAEGKESTALLTSLGKKATKADVIAAWEASQK